MIVNRLLVLAGPRCAGKSTFLEQIRAGTLPAIADPLGLGDLGDWRLVHGNELHALSGAALDRVLFHYNILRPWETGLPGFADDEALGILNASGERRMLTFWAAPAELRRHVRKRKVRILRSLPFGPRAGLRNLGTMNRIDAFYSRPGSLDGLYRQWFAFCRKYDDTSQFIVKVMKNEWRLFPAAEWRKIHEN